MLRYSLLLIVCLQGVLAGIRPLPPGPIKSVIRAERDAIATFKSENAHLTQLKASTKKECDKKFRELADEFDRLEKQLLHGDLPEIKRIEQQITAEEKKKDKIDAAIKKEKHYTDLLKLKKKVMTEDIKVLKEREGVEFETCMNYSDIIRFHPVNKGGVGLRSIHSGLPVINNLNPSFMENVTQIREKIILDIELEQESFDNQELKKYLAYYSGFCERRLKSMEKLIDELKHYPEHNKITEFKGVLEQARKEVAEKTEAYKAVHLVTRQLVDEIKQLQVQYDQLQNEANCFLKLDQWHIDDIVRQMEKDIQDLPHSNPDIETPTTKSPFIPEVKVHSDPDVDGPITESSFIQYLKDHSEPEIVTPSTKLPLISDVKDHSEPEIVTPSTKLPIISDVKDHSKPEIVTPSTKLPIISDVKDHSKPEINTTSTELPGAVDKIPEKGNVSTPLIEEEQ